MFIYGPDENTLWKRSMGFRSEWIKVVIKEEEKTPFDGEDENFIEDVISSILCATDEDFYEDDDDDEEED